jgi:hypothetical protein
MNDKIEKIGVFYSRWALFIIVFSGFLLLLLPWLFSQNSWKFDFTETGQIGDTIGGITAPIIGFMSSLLIYFSFMIQHKANQIQWTALREEQLIQRIQNNINELKLLNENLKLKHLDIYSFIESLIQTIQKESNFISIFITFKNVIEPLIIYLNLSSHTISEINKFELTNTNVVSFKLGVLSCTITYINDLKRLWDIMIINREVVVREIYPKYDSNSIEILNYEQLEKSIGNFIRNVNPLMTQFFENSNYSK